MSSPQSPEATTGPPAPSPVFATGRAVAAARIGVLACAAAVAAYLLFSVHSAPAEDAAMLMRYVQHLAAGQGIVWNIGDGRVDGATDLLPVLLAGGLAFFGVGAESAVRILALAAHVLTSLAILWGGRFRGEALLLSLLVLFGPGWFYANAGFVTPVFGLLAALLVLAIYRRGISASFALIAWLLALTRPEGTFLVVVVAASAVWFGRRQIRNAQLIPFGLALALYLLWRRWYFGDWIPSPYYAKGGFRLHVDGVLASFNYTARFLWFAAVPVLIAYRRARRDVMQAAVPVASFVLLWTLLANETNFGGRFQYAVLPMTAAWLAAAWRTWWPTSAAVRAVCVVTLCLAAAVNLGQYVPIALQDGRREVGLALTTFATDISRAAPSRVRTMIVTEAGLVPFYSNWRAVDALGLNDADIARRGLDGARLDRERPDVVFLHRTFSVNAKASPDAGIERTARLLLDYTRTNGYILARAWGPNADDTHDYLVRPDAPDAAALVAAIRQAPYACVGISTAEVGQFGSVRRLANRLRRVVEPGPACRDWSEKGAYAAR